MTTTPLAALEQHSASALRPDETFLAAIHVHAPDGGRATRDATFGIAVGSVMAYRAQKQAQRTSVIAIPAAGAFIGVTETRIIVFASGVMIRPGELIGAIDREGVTLSSDSFRQGLVKRAHVTLLDGDRTVLDAVCSEKSPDLEALRALIPAAA